MHVSIMLAAVAENVAIFILGKKNGAKPTNITASQHFR
jgi:hypothetical protein